MIQYEKSKMPHFRAFSIRSYILLDAKKKIVDIIPIFSWGTKCYCITTFFPFIM